MTSDRFLNNFATAIVNPLIALLIGLALAYFLWGLATFLYNKDDAGGRAEGKRKIIWGLIGLFIMVSVLGIINIVLGTFGISGI